METITDVTDTTGTLGTVWPQRVTMELVRTDEGLHVLGRNQAVRMLLDGDVHDPFRYAMPQFVRNELLAGQGGQYAGC